jgi:hypothetical protein
MSFFVFSASFLPDTLLGVLKPWGLTQPPPSTASCFIPFRDHGPCAPIDKIFNWPFIGAFVSGALLTLLIALIVARFWFNHRDIATLSMVGVTAGWGNVGYMGLPLLLTAYGPDGALPTTVSILSLIILFVGTAIAVLEGTQAAGSSPLGVVLHLTFAQPASDLSAARHPFFNDHIPSS